ncbi:hypothetical protein EON65_49270, partial [archaeon]
MSSNEAYLKVVSVSGFVVLDNHNKFTFQREVLVLTIRNGKCSVQSSQGVGTFKLSYMSIKAATVQSDGLKIVTNPAESAQFLRDLQYHMNAYKAALEAEKLHKLERKNPVSVPS